MTQRARRGVPLSFGTRPAAAMGLDIGRIADGGPADLVIFPARRWTELLARPWHDRLVIRGGRAVTDAAADYAELDHLFARATEPA